MARYQLKIKKSAEKELANLPVDIIEAIKARVLPLQYDPFTHGYKKLKEFKNFFRIRISNTGLFILCNMIC